MNANARQLLTLDCDSGDLWGWSMGHWFGIADTLTRAGEDCPADWEYRAGAGVSADTESEDYPDCEWAALLAAGEVSADDLRHVGNVLTRYTARLRTLGLDY